MEDSVPGENGDSTVALIDPLLEQMSSVLRLSSPPGAGQASSQRARRFSVGGVANDGLVTNTTPVAVRSQDGSRWLKRKSVL